MNDRTDSGIAAAGTPALFPAGTFTPAPAAAPPAAMLRSQVRMELTLLLRHGEQLMLTLLIPIAILVAVTLLPFGDFADPRVDHVLPMVLAVAVMSTAFTGQAIAVGFDRRYGALKRIGATALPKWGIVAGKSGAVIIVIIGQLVILGSIAAALGWRPGPATIGLILLSVAVGTVAFTTLGLLVGGRLKAEIVLALANIIWFALLAVAGLVLVRDDVPGTVFTLATLLPSGALTDALLQAQSGVVDWTGLGVLVVWGVLGGAAAVRTFRFE
ncbi:ABC transporter permease [Tomitella fengzijianii]|uniref:Multidrug ABC transporter permease n=1 Tax=Tomitella fengzijianii TaxID=2597660 RepID=A0A516X2Y7_9ACTN|nr:ABC transporter permease [Tomitella fengzijianii]QDQ97432.1 multidrug ABC transporter permease [Tomitella fengzijianii]